MLLNEFIEDSKNMTSEQFKDKYLNKKYEKNYLPKDEPIRNQDGSIMSLTDYLRYDGERTEEEKKIEKALIEMINKL